MDHPAHQRLAAIIAEALGWPLLSIDPSHFVRHGLDGVYAESNQVFSMLAIAERIVVLLDEFDEMVRERGGAADVLSRFLTTAMLPKIIKINENRRVVFIVATNHIEAFDIAISRPGRFDLILQVMPPTAAEKRRRWPIFDEIENATRSTQIDADLKPLTYAECEILVRRLADTTDRLGAIRAAAESCILNSTYALPRAQRPKRRGRVFVIDRPTRAGIFNGRLIGAVVMSHEGLCTSEPPTICAILLL